MCSPTSLQETNPPAVIKTPSNGFSGPPCKDSIMYAVAMDWCQLFEKYRYRLYLEHLEVCSGVQDA